MLCVETEHHMYIIVMTPAESWKYCRWWLWWSDREGMYTRCTAWCPVKVIIYRDIVLPSTPHQYFQYICLCIDLGLSSNLTSVIYHINIAISMMSPRPLFIPISAPALFTAVDCTSSFFLQHSMIGVSIWAFSKWGWRGTLRCSQLTGHLRLGC